MSQTTRRGVDQQYEVIIIGGGPAGLSAALVLGRSRRRVLLFDAGAPRNAPSAHAHSYLTRDGEPPSELVRIGRSQLAPYDGVTIRDEAVVDVVREGERFAVATAGGERVSASYLVLATGLVDELPDIPGVRELWGSSVLHCPYCHGWEVRDRAFAVYRRGPAAFDYLRIVRGWSRNIALCTDGPAELSAEQRAWLREHEVTLREEKIGALRVEGGELQAVEFAEGEPLPCEVLFLGTRVQQRSPLPEALGCRIIREEGPHYGMVEADENGCTGIDGLYVVGDAARGFPQLITAAAQGAQAAFHINHRMLLAGE